ncbi:MAG TPA: HEPN domain-containing protein, partial [Ktedonobacteraceae bacterium]
MRTGDRAGRDDDQDELERLIREGVSLDKSSLQKPGIGVTQPEHLEHLQTPYTTIYEDEDEEKEVLITHDVQGALGLFAEAAADLATAGVELGLGRHFACADFCNQAVEKAAQAVSLLRFGRRSMYNHDLRELGALVGAPPDIQEEMALLTPFHPEAFYVDTPPEEADEVISAQQAETYRQHTRHIL